MADSDELFLEIVYFRERWQKETDETISDDPDWFMEWCRDLLWHEGEIIASRKAWYGDPVFDIQLIALGGAFLLCAPEGIADEVFSSFSAASQALNNLASEWNKEQAELRVLAGKVLHEFLEQNRVGEDADAFKKVHADLINYIDTPEDFEKYIEQLDADIAFEEYLSA